jgi:hypothetical protein
LSNFFKKKGEAMFKVVIISVLCSVAALSQTSTQQVKIKLDAETTLGPIGITAALAGPMSTIPGAPYSAQAVTQRVQMLADGNRITQTTTNNVARDSKGRVRREESLPGLGNGEAEPPHLVLIEDPVAGVHITLDSNRKTAMKLTMQNAKERAEAKALVISDGFGPAISTGGPLAVVTSDDSRITRSDLGTQTIEGVAAKGTKITHTIPAGEMGNDLPIVITTETWFSPDLKVMVMSKSSDPRMGETTYKLTNLSRSEPDATLFQIPADYTVKDQPANNVIHFKDN